MKSIQTLIAQAREKVHTDRELAARLDIDPSELNHIKKGNRPPSPEIVALLCDLLELPGNEAREWVAISIIDNPKNAARVDVLKRALFACWALGVGVSLSTITTREGQAREVADSPIAITEREAIGFLKIHCRASLCGVRAWLRGLLVGFKTLVARRLAEVGAQMLPQPQPIA